MVKGTFEKRFRVGQLLSTFFFQIFYCYYYASDATECDCCCRSDRKSRERGKNRL